MPIEKNIPKVKQSSLSIPKQLEKRKEAYEDAGYKYSFDNKEQNYIRYNTLRNKRKDKELIDVVKIYRLQDRETGEEFLVYYQTSKVMDFNNNLVPCPIPECCGVTDVPKTNIIKNENDEVTDIVLTETQNAYDEPYSKDKVEELFNKSRSSANIACYVGFTKNPRTGANDFIENKKLIKDQEAFVKKEFDDLITLPDNLNLKRTFKNNKENALRKLKENKVIKVKDVEQKGIEKRVKDNGQLWAADTEVISEQIKAEEDAQSGANEEELKKNSENKNQNANSNSETDANKVKESGNDNLDSQKNKENKETEQQKLKVSRA